MTQETTGETLFTLVAVTRTSSSIQHVTTRRAGQRKEDRENQFFWISAGMINVCVVHHRLQQ